MDDTGSAGWVAAMLTARMAASALLGPFGGVIVDRLERQQTLIVIELVRAGAVGLMTMVVLTGTGPVVMIAIATVFSTVGTMYWTATASATPSIVPEGDLATANAVESTLYQAGWFAGPALATGLLAVGGSAMAFGVAAIAFLVSAGLVARIGRLGSGAFAPAPVPPVAVTPADTGEPGAGGRAGRPVGGSGLVNSLVEGAGAVRHIPGLLALTVLFAALMLSFGIEQVVQVFVVTERLGWDADGVGLLSAFIGLGGLVAAPMAGRVAASRRAGRWLGWSGVTIGVTLVLLAATTSPAVAMGLALVEGAGNIVFDVLIITMLQRTCPEALLGRVFSLQDSAGSVSQLLGTIVAPVMIGVVSLEAALVFGGGSLAVLAVALLPALAAISARTEAERTRLAPVVRRLGALGLFDDATRAQLERMARVVRPVSVGAGAVVFQEGDPPDDLYVIDRGEVSVQSQASGEVGRLGQGDWFGEIGLLRGVPRTASIVAAEDTSLLAVPGQVFVDAITGRGSLPDPIERAMCTRLARTHPKLAIDRGPV